MNQLILILNYMLENILHTWPYLLITIPIAVGVNMSGMSKYINQSFSARPILAIFLSTFLGAFSPLCSASVIPVVAALLIGGVPLAPVMSFWLASPSMDPEMFFLTVSVLGWELAVWRLVSALVLSLGGGFVTHILVQRDILGTEILRDVQSTEVKSMGEILKRSWQSALEKINAFLAPRQEVVCMTVDGCAITLPREQQIVINPGRRNAIQAKETSGETSETTPDKTFRSGELGFWKRLGKETWDASTLVFKFMLLAWFIGALIDLYVPEAWIISTLGSDKNWSIIVAALLGIPMYASNLAVMPLMGGLLAGGMHPGAALAFLIAGPVTTLPAMSAVWGLVNRRVFALYIGFSLVGAVVLGFAYSLTL